MTVALQKRSIVCRLGRESYGDFNLQTLLLAFFVRWDWFHTQARGLTELWTERWDVETIDKSWSNIYCQLAIEAFWKHCVGLNPPKTAVDLQLMLMLMAATWAWWTIHDLFCLIRYLDVILEEPVLGCILWCLKSWKVAMMKVYWSKFQVSDCVTLAEAEITYDVIFHRKVQKVNPNLFKAEHWCFYLRRRIGVLLCW